MICDRCHQNPAQFNIQMTINGRAHTQRVCAACAHLIQQNPGAGVASLLSGLAGLANRERAAAACGNCGMTAAQLAKAGRVGCAQCYSVFAETLTPFIRQIHGAAVYQGDAPMGYTPPSGTQVNALKAAMQAAVERQAYEEAAALRDQIKALEASL